MARPSSFPNISFLYFFQFLLVFPFLLRDVGVVGDVPGDGIAEVAVHPRTLPLDVLLPIGAVPHMLP